MKVLNKLYPIGLAFIFACGHNENESIAPDIFEAVKKGDIQKVKEAIKHGADVNAKDNRGWPLWVYAKNKEVLDLLVKNGAKIPGFDVKKYNKGYTPLHLAAENGSKEVVKLLIKYGANVNAYGAVSVPVTATLHVFAPRVIKISKTPLHIAVERGYKDIAELLIKHGADVNAKDRYGETPLHYAARVGRRDIAELLIKHGANVNAKDMYSKTSCDYAEMDELIKLVCPGNK